MSSSKSIQKTIKFEDIKSKNLELTKLKNNLILDKKNYETANKNIILDSKLNNFSPIKSKGNKQDLITKPMIYFPTTITSKEDKKEINYNYRGKYEKNRLKHEIIENNNQNIYLNNVLNISNDYIRNKKYNNTFIHVPNSKNVNSNPKSIKNKYLIMDNNNSLRNKFSEDEINKRIETSFGKNNNSNTHTHIISQRNTTKKFSHVNIQSSSNFSTKNNNINNSRRKDNKRQNKINNGKNEESKEKEQSIYIKNKVIIYPNKNINENKNYRYNNDSYKYKYEKSNYHRNNRKRRKRKIRK